MSVFTDVLAHPMSAGQLHSLVKVLFILYAATLKKKSQKIEFDSFISLI